jgi:hypothetical protein
MAQANHSLFLTNRAVSTLARYYATRDVKRDLRSRRGHSALRRLPARELQRLAQDWLAQHPELITEARAFCAKLTTNAQQRKAPKFNGSAA